MDDDDAWVKFLEGPIGSSTTAAERELLRTGGPLRHRAPTMTLYWGLLLYHRGHLTLEELERSIDENEQLERSVAAKQRDGDKTRKDRLRLVRS